MRGPHTYVNLFPMQPYLHPQCFLAEPNVISTNILTATSFWSIISCLRRLGLFYSSGIVRLNGPFRDLESHMWGAASVGVSS